MSGKREAEQRRREKELAAAQVWADQQRALAATERARRRRRAKEARRRRRLAERRRAERERQQLEDDTYARFSLPDAAHRRGDPDPLLVGPARAVGIAASVVRTGRTITKHTWQQRTQQEADR